MTSFPSLSLSSDAFSPNPCGPPPLFTKELKPTITEFSIEKESFPA